MSAPPAKVKLIKPRSLLRICKVLKCDVTEIMEIEYDESDSLQ
jgi:DNA-binding Xre family transcriptional regulator